MFAELHHNFKGFVFNSSNRALAFVSLVMVKVKRRKKHLSKTTLIWQLVLSTRELQKTQKIELVFKYYNRSFIHSKKPF